MHSLAVYIAQRLVEKNIADEERKEEYVYGLEIVLGKILNYSTLLALAAYNNVLIPSLFFMATFFSLRERTGGFHAKTATRCYFGTIGIYLILVKGLIPLIAGNLYLYLGILSASSMIIIALAPVNHPSLGLDRQEIEKCKKSSRRLLLLYMTCIGLALLLGLDTIYIAYAIAGIGMGAILLLIAKIIKQEMNENEESD